MDDHPMVFGTSSRSTVTRGSSEELRVQRSSKDLQKIFEMKAHSRIFARWSRSKINKGSLEVLRYRRAFKDLRKTFEIKDHSRTFRISSISNIIKGFFCNGLPQNTICYFRRAISLSFGHKVLLVYSNAESILEQKVIFKTL